MTDEIQGNLKPYLEESACIRAPEGFIPVTAIIDREKVQIGKGTLDPKTGVFTTVLDTDSPDADKIREIIDWPNNRLSVSISEAQAFKED